MNEVLTSLSQLLVAKLQLLVLDFWPFDDEEDSKMFFASNDNDLAALEGLLQQPRPPNVIDPYGDTPLHYTAWNGYLESTQVLLEAGAEKDARGFQGMTPLHWASWCVDSGSS